MLMRPFLLARLKTVVREDALNLPTIKRRVLTTHVSSALILATVFRQKPAQHPSPLGAGEIGF